MLFKLSRLPRPTVLSPSVGRPIGLVPNPFSHRFQSRQAANMPTITMKDPKVQLELPNDLASDDGKEVVNFPPFKVRPLSSPQLISPQAQPRHHD